MSFKTLVTSTTSVSDLPEEFLDAYVWVDGIGSFDPNQTRRNEVKVISASPSTMEIGWTEIILKSVITGKEIYRNFPNDTQVHWHVWAEDMDPSEWVA